MSADLITQSMLKLLELMLADTPRKTSYGVLLGAIIHGGILIGSDVIKEISRLDFEKAPLYFWIALGVFITHNLIKEKKPLSIKEAEAFLDFIQKGKEIGISEVEIRRHFRQAVVKVSESLELNEKIKADLKQMRILTSRMEAQGKEFVSLSEEVLKARDREKIQRSNSSESEIED